MAESSLARIDPGPVTAADSPGTFRVQTAPTLHTRFAQSLYEGRPYVAGGPPPILGLEHFSRLAAQIWRAAQYDDPYADAALLRIEEALAATRKGITDHCRQIVRVFDAMGEIEIDLGASVTPVRLRLEFTTPYGHQGGFLLKDYDDLARALLTARMTGMMDRDRVFGLQRETRRAMRRCFSLPLLLWRYTGVTRQDVHENTVLAQQAAAVYASTRKEAGELPAEVVEGTRRGRFAPQIVRERARPRFLEEDGDEPATS